MADRSDRMVPDNEMPINGVKNPQDRADLLAFLEEATKPGAVPQRTAQAPTGGMGEMMGGMMVGGGQIPNLKSLEPNIQVKAITYCHDSYRVTLRTTRRGISGSAICG